jgi:hypothetical protein
MGAYAGGVDPPGPASIGRNGAARHRGWTFNGLVPPSPNLRDERMRKRLSTLHEPRHAIVAFIARRRGRWTTEADEGRWELFRMPGYLCGMASYVLVGEAAVGRVLAGTLDQPGFPPRLGRDGPQKWMWEARFWLQHAGAHADAGDIAACVGKCSSAIVAVAQARLLERSEWALNEKGSLLAPGSPRSKPCS